MKPTPLLRLFLLGSPLLAAQTLNAATLYWDVDGTTSGFSSVVGEWNGTNSFWNTSSTGGSGSVQAGTTSADDLIIKQATTNTGDITVTGTRQASSITFAANVGPVANITGGSIIIGGTGASSGIFQQSSGANTVSSSLTLNSANSSFNFGNSSTGLLTIGTITGSAASGTQTISVSSSSTGGITLSGAIGDGSGGGNVALAINNSGTGSTTLSGTNSFSGGVNLGTAASTLNINNASAIGTGALTIAAAGAIDNTSGGAITLTTNNTQNWNSNFTFTGTNSLNMGTGAVTINANRTVTVTVNTLTVGGIGQDVAGRTFTKAGAGTLAISGTSSYTGSTTVSGGVLKLDTAAALPGGVGATGGTSLLILNGGVLGLTSSFTRSMGSGAANFQMNNGGFAAYGATRTVTPGTLSFGPTVGTNIVGNLTLSAADSDATITWASGISLASSSGTRSVDVRNGSATVDANISGVISGGSGTLVFQKLGEGTLRLSGANSYPVATRILAGAIEANTLANGGSNSSIGASSNLASNLRLDNGTTLRYTGTGHSTDRGFTINGTAVGHGATLEATGTGAANFTSTASPAYGTVDQTRTLTLAGTSTASNTLAANIANNGTGAVSLVKNGSGTWVLSGDSTYTGTTTINGGALRMDVSGTISNSSNVVINTAGNWNIRNTDGWTYTGTITGDDTGQINLNTGTNVTLTGNISGLSKIHTNNDGTVATITGDISGSVAIDVQSTGNSKLILSGNNTYTGATRILSSTGTLEVRGSIANSSSIDNIGSLIFNSSSNQSYGNVISNTGTLTKQGTGTLTLSAANTYSGNTTISDGIISLDNSLALQNSALDTTASIAGTSAAGLRTSVTSLTFGGLTGNKGFANVFTTTSGGYSGLTTLTLNPGTGASYSYSAAIGDGAGGMTLTKTGVGTQILTAANTYTGLTTINAGILRITDAGALGGTGAGVVVNGVSGGTTVARLELAGGITVTGESATIKGGGNFLGALSSFSGVNEWAGNVTVDAASTRIGASAGATLKVSGVIDSGVNAYGLTIRTGDTSSPVILSGANTYIGETTIAVGKLQLDGGNDRLPIATKVIMGSGTNLTEFDLNGRSQEVAGLAITSGATAANNTINNTSATISTLTVNTAAASPSSFAGILNGNLALTKTGSDVLTLSAANSYTGATTVSGGTLIINGNISTSTLTTVESGATLGGSGTVGALTIDSGGSFSPGNSPGIMTVDGDYIQNGQLNVEIEGLTAGNGTGFHDRVDVTGTVTLNGVLNLASFTGFTPVNGDLIFILLNDDTDAISGTFTGLAQGAVVGNYLGFDWQISYTANSGGNSFSGGNDVALMAIPEPRAAMLGSLGLLMLIRRRR